MLSLVVAASRNGVIGRDGDLPWRLSSDLKRFKQITMGKPVIMGRKTWDSLPRKPLPGRRNIVISRQSNFTAEGAECVASVNDALALVTDVEEACVIGGGEIYRQFLPFAQRVYLTIVDLEVEGDTRFPELGEEWKLVESESHGPGDKDDASFTFKVFDRHPVN